MPQFCEKRVGEGGKAEPFSYLTYFSKMIFSQSTINPDKHKDRDWFAGEDPLEVSITMKLLHKHREENQELYEKMGYKLETINQLQTGRGKVGMLHPQEKSNPHFSDYVQSAYAVSYDRAKYTVFLKDQYNHCVGNLGEDHPTCRKALWYRQQGTPALYAAHYEEMAELGHHDMTKKYGIKRSPSFLPTYQPVKKNIPGAYEYYRSESYLEKYDMEGENETWGIATMLE